MTVLTKVTVVLCIFAVISVVRLSSLPHLTLIRSWVGAGGSNSRRLARVGGRSSANNDAIEKVNVEASEWQSPAVTILLGQLNSASLASAGPIHGALAQLYKADGRDRQALMHLQAAVDAATRSGNVVQAVDALVLLGQAYLRDGRPLDAERELVEASHLLETSYSVYGVHSQLAVDRALGHARRDLGQLDSALGLYKRALSQPGAKPVEDIAGLLSDVGEVHQVRGNHAEALKYLQQAHSSLREHKGISPMSNAPAGARVELDSEIHRRMAEAYSGLGKATESETYFKAALRLEKQLLQPRQSELTLITAGIAKLHKTKSGSDVFLPSLQHESAAARWWRGTELPGSSARVAVGEKQTQSSDLESQSGKLQDAMALQAAGKLEKGEALAERVAQARVREAGGVKGAAVAAAMNLLGNIRRQRQRFLESSEAYLSALTAALATPRDGGGIGGSEAEDAYLGISYIMPEFVAHGSGAKAAELLASAVSVADKAGVAKNSEERLSYESRLRANAINPVFRLPVQTASVFPGSFGSTSANHDRASYEQASGPGRLKSSDNSGDAARWWWQGKVVEGVDAGVDQRGSLRKQGRVENPEVLLATGKLEEAEGASRREVGVRVQEAGGLKGADVAAAFNQLGNIRRQRQNFQDASKAYLNALVAALATPRDGGGVGGKQAEVAYLGLSYIMPMLQLFGQPQEAEVLLAKAIAIADAAGVPKDSSERQSFEQRLRANAVHPVYRIAPEETHALPSFSDGMPSATFPASRGADSSKPDLLGDSEDLPIHDDDKAAAMEVSKEIGKWFRDPQDPAAESEQQAKTTVNFVRGEEAEQQLYDSF